jgi:hypothetical protein
MIESISAYFHYGGGQVTKVGSLTFCMVVHIILNSYKQATKIGTHCT